MDDDVAADCRRRSRSCDTDVVEGIDTDTEVPGPSSSSVLAAKEIIPDTPRSPSPEASAILAAKEKIPDTPRSPSPEPELQKCAICLGDLVNKSYSNSCLHQFCFGCLLEWSKIKPECPLCKSVFRTIIHNIRTNSEFDEYVVPLPNPEESFNLNSISFANVLYPTRNPDSYFLGHHHHHHSNEDHGYSMTRPARMDSSRIEHPSPSRYIRILELGTGISDAFDTFMHSISPHRYSHQHPNPFITDHPDPETFGSSLHLPNSSSSSSNQAGYQARKRIYDRGTWISPFNSTLQPGSVFFPSIEYFRTHPMAIHRLVPWLYRELQVLLGLRLSQAELANLYSIIIDLIRRYDIRSPEFREFLKGYFGNHVRQFAHEFYHFVLSGMRIEEYDRTAVYPSPSRSNNNNQPSTSSSTVFEVERTPYDEPLVITISSSDSENEEETIIPTNVIRANSNNQKNDDIIVIDSNSDDDNDNDTVQETQNGETDRIRAERNLREARDLHRDLLDLLDVDIIDDPDDPNPNSTPATSTRNNNQDQSEIRDSRGADRYNSQEFLDASLLVREESASDYPVDLSLGPIRRSRDNEYRATNLASFVEANKRVQHENEDPSSSHHSNSNSNRHESERKKRKSELPEMIHTIERPPRPRSPSYPSPVMYSSHSHTFLAPESTSNLNFGWPPTTAFNDLIRPVVTSSNILLKQPQNSNNNPSYSSIGYTTTTVADKKDDAGGESSDSDICEYLGIHPIEKPPPLAIITISDSDEEKEEKPSTSASALAELKIKFNIVGEAQEVSQPTKSDHQSESSDDSENDRPKHFTRHYKKINPKPKAELNEAATKKTSKSEKNESESEIENQSEAEAETDESDVPKRTRNYYNRIKNHSKSKPKKRKQKREKSDSDEVMNGDDDQVPVVPTKKTKSKRKRQKREIQSSDEDENEITEEITDKKGSKIELRPRPRKSKSPSKKKSSSSKSSSSKSKKSKKSKKKKRRCYRESSSADCSPPQTHPPNFTSTDTDED